MPFWRRSTLGKNFGWLNAAQICSSRTFAMGGRGSCGRCGALKEGEVWESDACACGSGPPNPRFLNATLQCLNECTTIHDAVTSLSWRRLHWTLISPAWRTRRAGGRCRQRYR